MKKLFIAIAILFLASYSRADEDVIDGHLYENFEVTDWAGMTQPATSPVNYARIYYDSTSDQLMLSEDTMHYHPIMTSASGTCYFAGVNNQHPLYIPYADYPTNTHVEVNTIASQHSIAKSAEVDGVFKVFGQATLYNDLILSFHDITQVDQITANTLTGAYLTSTITGMGLDMTGDPWYLSGVSLQVDETITADHFFGVLDHQHSKYVPYIGATTLTQLGSQHLEAYAGMWTGGNITYVPIDGDIEAYVTAATAGDTLVLAAGTYTIIDDIDIAKAINIVGQGANETIISCATTTKNVLDISASNINVSDLSISSTVNTAGDGVAANISGAAGTVLTNVNFSHVNISLTAAGGNTTAFNYNDAGGTVRDSYISCSGTSGVHLGVKIQTNSTAEANCVVNCYNVYSYTTTTAGSYVGAFEARDNSSSNNAILNTYDCQGVSAGTASNGYGAFTFTGADSSINAYNCVFNGTDFDVGEISSGGDITLYDTTLVNGTTSGTITYDGTIVTEDLYVADDETIANGGTLQINSAGDDKNVQISHNDTDAIATVSSGSFLMNADTDFVAALGRAKIGYDGTDADFAIFAHYDAMTSTNYALAQGTAGATYINAASGQKISFGNNGSFNFNYDGTTLKDQLLTTSTTAVQAMNLINNAKFDMIEDLNNLIGTSSIKGFWVFDQTGATTAVTDRSPNAHALTLGGNASTLSPSVAGLCPNLTMAGTGGTSCVVTDHADFSFAGDVAFSLIALVNMTSQADDALISKSSSTGSNYEWTFRFASNKIYAGVFGNDYATYIYRYYNTSLASDIGAWHCYIMTYSGSEAVAGIKIYRDGVQIDDSSLDSGGYVGMTAGNANVANFWTGSGAYSAGKYGVTSVVSKELTAAECSRISKRLLAYAGLFQ